MAETTGSINLPSEIDMGELRDEYIAALALLNAGIDGWAIMTGAQKQTWVADHMDEIMRILRALMKLLRIMVTT